MAAIAGYKGKVSGQSGPSTAFTNQACTDIGATVRTVYQITDSTKRMWDSGVAFTVQVSTDGGTTWNPATGYTLQYLGGKITFTAQQPLNTTVRVSGNAYPMVDFALFKSWNADLDVKMLDVTELNGGGNEAYIPGLTGGTVKCEGFWLDSYFYSKLTGGAIAVLSLYPDASSNHYDCQTYVSKLSIKDEVSGTVDETRDFQISGAFFFN